MRTERIRQLLAVAAFWGLFLLAGRLHGDPPAAPKWKAADLAPAKLNATPPTPYAAAYQEVKSGGTAVAYVGVGEANHGLVKQLAAGDSSGNAVPVLLRPCSEFPAQGVWLLYCDSGGVVRAIPQALAAPPATTSKWTAAAFAHQVPTPVPSATPWVPLSPPAFQGGLQGGLRPSAPQRGPAWRLSLAEAKVEAGKTGKPIAVSVSGANCPPCRRMDQDTFTNGRVVRHLTHLFVPVRLVAEESPLEVQQLNVQQWPTTVVLDASGRELRRVTGYRGPDDFLSGLHGGGEEPKPKNRGGPIQHMARALARPFGVGK